MHPTRHLPEAMRDSCRRIAIHAAVISVHLVAWLVCFHGTVPAWRAAPTGSSQLSNPLKIRLLAIAFPVLPHAPAVRPTRSRRPSRVHRHASARPPVSSVPMASMSAPATAPSVAVSDYVPGGGRLQGSASPPPVRLPGSGTPVMQGFRMVDPRMQGVGGAVRTLQTLFGVVDPHCVDVEVWRGMTVAEQLARHISSDDVERTAERYHCGPG